MARIRTIKPEFWVSEQIGNCSRDARLLFIGMWNFCDDQGVHPAKTMTLKAEVCPQDDDITSAKVAVWVQELVSVGLVAEFESEDCRYWHVTGWSKHQRIDRVTNKHPPPPESSSSPRRALDVHSTTARPRKGMEGKGLKATSVSPTADRPKRPNVPSPPFDTIRLAFNAKLPDLPRAKLVTAPRKRAMTTRWEWIFATPKDDGTPRATTADEALAWLDKFFEKANDNDFVMGRTPRSAAHQGWRCDIDYLLSDKGLAQVLEKTA
jgi:hypothetical protein